MWVDNGLIPTIRLSGNVQLEASPEIEGAFREVLARRCESVHLDAAGVTGIDDRGLQALVENVRAAEARGVAVKLTHASRRLRTALRQLGPGARPGPVAPVQSWDVDLTLPCSPKSVSVIRGYVAELAGRLPFGATEVEDVVLAVGEAAANAVRHSIGAGRTARIEMRCRVDHTGLLVEITDPGDGFDPEHLRRPDPREQRAGGLGIYLMRRIMDEVTYTFDARGTTVRLLKRCPPIESH